ncbi:hypothetical protein RhiJN_20589 [Ceratobasidium sp. AG-Ba]|nr:hypothetical protein RhiJN_20589 [Ceratobasidium sp. AG-Ba]
MPSSKTVASINDTSAVAPIDPRLLELLRVLRNLPASLADHPSIYPFLGFTLEHHDIEHYGSPQNALNHKLSLIFGSRVGGRLIQFRGRGESLEAIVHTFSKYIDGESGENQVLWNWVQDLTQAAKESSKLVAKQTKRGTPKSRTPRRGQKSTRAVKPKLSEAKVKQAKARSAIRYPHDPADLEDKLPDVAMGQGRPRSEMLDKLVTACHSIVDPSHLRVRCRGTGCGWSWAEPRQSGRVLKHAVRCPGLDEDLKIEAKRQAASLSLASKLKIVDEDSTYDLNNSMSNETRLERNARIDHALLKLLCDRMIPPSLVDCFRWKQFIREIDPDVSTASGTTFSNTFITTETAYIHQQSINALSQQDLLTLSFDGGTTRKHESIYTVHVTTPTTRDAYLMEGNEASGISHTAEHYVDAQKTLREIGPEHFISIISDNAGNTSAARKLIEAEYPWIIALQDACHLLNNAAKDVGHLEHFQHCISRLKTIITHFHTSAYAARHLAALRVLYHIAKGLAAIGLTRFATYYYASLSTLQCLPLIRELISSGVLELKPSSPIYWMLDRTEVQKFEGELSQFVAVLEPFARAIKCLKSSHATLSDVYLFWLAILAHFQNIFKNNTRLSGTGLPDSVMEEITSILNGRHTEMFRGHAGCVYLAACFLTSATEVQTYSHVIQLDYQLITGASIPAYTLVGDYLIKLLARIYNRDPDAAVFARYTSWGDIEVSFRNQLVLFTRGLSPFHQTPKPSTEHMYWESLRSIPSADLLAHLGLTLGSIVPNSMADERTMSTLTKLNSPDRASQKASTLIEMATIRQHYKREENAYFQVSKALRPTVRFADLPQYVPSSTPTNPSLTPTSNSQQSILEAAEYLEDVLALGESSLSQNEGISATRGSGQHFEVELTDGVFLGSSQLVDLISDRPGKVTKPSHTYDLPPAKSQPPHKRQKVDIRTLMY